MKVSMDKSVNKKQVRNIIIAIIAVLLIGFCVVKIFINTSDIAKLNAKNQELSQKYEEQLEENEKLKQIVNSDNKDEYIKDKAREEGYAEEGETQFYNIEGSK